MLASFVSCLLYCTNIIMQYLSAYTFVSSLSLQIIVSNLKQCHLRALEDSTTALTAIQVAATADQEAATAFEESNNADLEAANRALEAANTPLEAATAAKEAATADCYNRILGSCNSKFGSVPTKSILGCEQSAMLLLRLLRRFHWLLHHRKALL